MHLSCAFLSRLSFRESENGKIGDRRAGKMSFNGRCGGYYLNEGEMRNFYKAVDH